METEGEPLFVDVDSGQQFPMFSQLISAEEASALAKVELPKRIQSVKTETTQNETEARTQPSEAKTQDKNAKKPAKKFIELHYSCDLCQRYRSETEEELARHLRNKHNVVVKPSYSCDVCHQYKAETEEQLIKHLHKHRKENKYKCDYCEYSTYHKAVFEEHIRVHKGIKPFKCMHCDYRSASKKNAKKHENIHIVDNPKKCKDCGYIARNPQSLKYHRVMKHKYEKPKRIYSCKHCDTHFTSKTKINDHIKEVHEDKKECLFNCALCEWSSNNKQRILLHLVHHPNQKIDENVIDLTVLRKYGIIE